MVVQGDFLQDDVLGEKDPVQYYRRVCMCYTILAELSALSVVLLV